MIWAIVPLLYAWTCADKWLTNSFFPVTAASARCVDPVHVYGCYLGSPQYHSAAECIEEFDLDGDGLLSHTELGTCLEEVLKRGGCDQAKRTSAAMLEEWALRSEGLAAGQGALDRLLRAAAGYIREMTPKEDVEDWRWEDCTTIGKENDCILRKRM